MVLFETLLRFYSKQHVPKKDRDECKRKRLSCRSQPVNGAVFSTSASCQTTMLSVVLCFVSVCDLVAAVPSNTFGNDNMKAHPKRKRGKKKQKKQLPIIAGKTAGLLNNECFFLCLEVCAYLLTFAPLHSFGNLNTIAQKWKKLRLTVIQDIYSDICLKACRTSWPDV